MEAGEADSAMDLLIMSETIGTIVPESCLIIHVGPKKNNFWFPIADRPLPMFATH